MTENKTGGKHLFPWTTILVLASATLLMVAAEMLPAALLAPLSAGLGVSEAATGTLVSIWAAVVMVASLPLSRFARRWRARPVIVVALLLLAASSVLTAVAPDFAVVVVARVLGAAAVGVLWATVNAFVADIVPDQLLGRAIAVVLGGGTLGMVVGTPLARLLADASDWRFAFAALGVALAAAAAAVRFIVPLRERSRPVAPAAGRSRGKGVGLLTAITLLVAVTLIGHYGAYTFLTRLAAPAAETLPGGMSSLLLAFGAASAAGLVVAARVERRTTAALVASLLVTAVAVAALSVASAPIASLAVVLLWGLGSGAFPPLAQTLILRTAGIAHRDLAGALIPVLFNGGIAVGAGAASALVGAGGPMTLPLPAAAVIAAAAVVLAVVSLSTVRGRLAVSHRGTDAGARTVTEHAAR